MPRLENSESGTSTITNMFELTWNQRARSAIAHGALTNSKRPECLVKGIYPTHLTRGVGAYVWDTTGRRYIDFICGLGSNILGYANEEVNGAIAGQLRNGATLSLGTTLEVEVAEKVKEMFPFVERLRFLKTGSDACSAAVRIARAKTRRTKVLSGGYHGFHDLFVSLTPPALGVASYQDIERFTGIEQIGKDTAAVIIEPVMLDASDVRREWLGDVRRVCTRRGAMLIFDEIITGFRWPSFSVSNNWGITPDIICLGKAMANGMPISVVGGRLDVMECGEWFVSSTFAGETLSLAAALKTMSLLQAKYRLSDLWARGEAFITRFNQLWPEMIRIDGYPTRGAFTGDLMTKALLWQEACRAGIMFGPSFFFNFQHIDLSEQVLNTLQDIITRLKTGSVRLDGQMPTTPFAAKQRGTT